MDAVEQVHQWQRRYSVASGELKARASKHRRVVLGLLVIGAALCAVPFTGTQIAGALCLAVAGLSQLATLGEKNAATWVGTRRISEGLKRLMYLGLMDVDGYGTDRILEEADQLFDDDKAAVSAAEDFEPDSPGMPSVASLEDYVRERCDGQIAYYAKAVQDRKEAAKQWRILEACLALLAAALGVIAASTSFDSAALVGVATTAAALVGTHVAANRYDLDAELFAITRTRLEAERSKLDVEKANAKRTEAFVVAVEDILAVEHSLWVRNKSAE